MLQPRAIADIVRFRLSGNQLFGDTCWIKINIY
jgi:hypothetical protein